MPLDVINDCTESEVLIASPDMDGDVSSFLLTENKNLANCKRLLVEIESTLLGSFGLEGNYKISENIIKELIAVNKTVKEEFAGGILLEAKHKTDNDLTLNFSLTFAPSGSTRRAASLYILEKIYNAGAFCDIKSTLVATYVDLDDSSFNKKCFDIFHIVKKDDSEGQYIDEALIQSIMELKKKKGLIKAKFNSAREVLDKEFVERLSKALSECGKYGEYVLKNFEKAKFETFGEMKVLPKDYYRKLADMLLLGIEQAGTVLLSKQLQEMLTEILESRCNYYENLTKPAPVETKKAEQKPKAKSPSASSSGGGSSKKSGGASKASKSSDVSYYEPKDTKIIKPIEIKPKELKPKEIKKPALPDKASTQLEASKILAIISSNGIKTKTEFALGKHHEQARRVLADSVKDKAKVKTIKIDEFSM